MTITTRDQLIDALANNSSRIVIDKASLANAVAGQTFSLWRATGVPGQGAIPTTAAICTSALTGCFGFANQTAPVTSYLAWLWLATGNATTNIEIHDRLAHMGGLSGTVTTAQGALTLAGLSSDRLGDANYSDVQWWLEWYADTGSTNVNATANVTYNDDTTGNLAGVALGATARTARLFPLVSAVAGKFIKAVNSVTLSATTGTAGNFGITATRPRTVVATAIANKIEQYDWAALGLVEVPNDACLFPIMLCSTTSTGTVRGGGKIAHG
jgi:hypothetical protein